MLRREVRVADAIASLHNTNAMAALSVHRLERRDSPEKLLYLFISAYEKVSENSRSC